MLNKIHEILKDPECKSNVDCIVLAWACVCLYMALMVYAVACFNISYKKSLSEELECRVAKLEKVVYPIFYTPENLKECDMAENGKSKIEDIFGEVVLTDPLNKY